MYKNLECRVPNLLTEYSQYMRVIKNRSLKTVEQYQNDLVLFMCYMKAYFDGLSLEPEDYVKVDISKVDADFMAKVRPEHIYAFLSYIADMFWIPRFFPGEGSFPQKAIWMPL